MDFSAKGLIERLELTPDILNKGGVSRKRVNFSMVSNTLMDDSNIPIETRGLYAMIQRWITYYDNQRLDKAFLRKKANVGIEKFDRMWKELKTFGYLKQYKISGGKSKFVYLYELLDEPDLTNVGTINLPLSDFVQNI